MINVKQSMEERFCPECGKEMDTVIRSTQETYPVKGEDITIMAHVRYCESCGCDIWDDELDAQNLLTAYAAYREKHHLLQPAEIKEIRIKYDMSQTAFARVLGMGDKTITRYENGSIADAAQNNLLYLVQQPQVFSDLLERNKEKISEAEYQRAKKAIGELECHVYPS